MTSRITFKILEDIARDLSSNEVSFPTFLDITFQVRNALKNPNLTIEQLAKLVGAEPLMSTRIIRMANSVAMNPSGREIADVKSGILRVGMEAVRTVSFAVAMSQLRHSSDMAPFEPISKKLWEHSSHVASMSRVLARKIARINGDEAMFAGLVHDVGVFYLMSRAAPYPELVNDLPELHALLAGWHDNIGHALLSAMGQPESILQAVQEHEVDREISEIKTLPDVLYIANKMANRLCPWRDPELDGVIDTSVLDRIFDADTLAEITTESEEEVQSLKAALGG
ncbi:MAG: putative nicotinate-nucleotide adenylyltransferase [Betaproteobacteria bacterium ADurb.Bin341]|nr:MAG: putative nicotinate-nucleotide adenylyltransferase [Betaproteobacteria bacterium ADurb.Bin341]